jgi:hypothetical protein
MSAYFGCIQAVNVGVLSFITGVFNYEKPSKDNPFFDDGQEGMLCKCETDCDRMDYTSEIFVTEG